MDGDLLGSPTATLSSDLFSVDAVQPGKTVDLSGATSLPNTYSVPGSFQPGRGSSSSAGFGSSSYSGGSSSYGGGGGGGSNYNGHTNGYNGAGSSRGPSSIEGGGSGMSLSALTPANIMRQLASRPITELVSENGRLLLQAPRVMARAYSATARKYLRPWNEFMRIRPQRIVEGIRQASRRGEVQIYLQRNVLANAKSFGPNYAFIYFAMLLMFVCTSPYLLCMLAAVGGGWSHALRSESFRNRPWMLQIGGVQVPLGSNLKMLLMSLPTLLFLHMFMGPVLWSAALCSGGASVAHAALRDRDDDHDDDDHGLGHDTYTSNGSSHPSMRLRDMA